MSRHRSETVPAYSCFGLVTAPVGSDVSVGFYELDRHTLYPRDERCCRPVAGGEDMVRTPAVIWDVRERHAQRKLAVGSEREIFAE